MLLCNSNFVRISSNRRIRKLLSTVVMAVSHSAVTTGYTSYFQRPFSVNLPQEKNIYYVAVGLLSSAPR